MSSNEKEVQEQKENEEFVREMKTFRRRNRWKFPFIFAFIVLAKGALVMLLWNYLIPDLFHGPEVNYLQSIGLIVLAKLIFGFGMHRFGGFGGGPFGHHHHHHGHGRHRWGRLSREEREKLREHMRTRHGFDRK